METRLNPGTFLLLLSCLAPACGGGVPAPPERTPWQRKFAGSPACAECHPEETELWRGTMHEKALRRAGRGTPEGDWKARMPEEIRPEGEIPFLLGVAPLAQPLVRGEGGRLQAYEYAWSTKPKTEGGQRWFPLHPEEKLVPGDPLHWTGRLHTANTMCLECHVTGFEKGYNPEKDRYRSTWVEDGVGCEACHGPSAEHVAWARNLPAKARRRITKAQRDEAPKDLGLGRRTPPWRPGAWNLKTAIATRDVPPDPDSGASCAPCHARRRPLRARPSGGAFLDDFRPDLLEETLYFPDGQMRDEVFVWASFQTTRMHAAGVTCADCHEPHGLKPRAEGNGLCARCHLMEVFKTPKHDHHGPEILEVSPEEYARGGLRCIDCHMPLRTYMRIDPRRDHSFPVPDAETALDLDLPLACLGCHTAADRKWAAEAMRDWKPRRGAVALRPFTKFLARGRAREKGARRALLSLAGNPDQPPIVRATAIELQGRYEPRGNPIPQAVEKALSSEDPLLRMAAASWIPFLPDPLEAGRRLCADEVLAVRLAAARAFLSEPRYYGDPVISKALAESEAAFRATAERPEAALGLAELARARGEWTKAEDHLRRGLERAPDHVPLRVNLADLLRERGRDEEGERLLRAGLAGEGVAGAAREWLRKSPALHYALALRLIRAGRLAEAIPHLRKAVEGAPRDPVYRRTLELAEER